MGWVATRLNFTEQQAGTAGNPTHVRGLAFSFTVSAAIYLSALCSHFKVDPTDEDCATFGLVWACARKPGPLRDSYSAHGCRMQYSIHSGPS